MDLSTNLAQYLLGILFMINASQEFFVILIIYLSSRLLEEKAYFDILCVKLIIDSFLIDPGNQGFNLLYFLGNFFHKN